MIKAYDNFVLETFPEEQHYYLVLIGSAYSTVTSNTKDLQYMLEEDWTHPTRPVCDLGTDCYKEDVISLTTTGASANAMNDFLPGYTEGDGPLTIGNQDLEAFFAVSWTLLMCLHFPCFC